VESETIESAEATRAGEGASGRDAAVEDCAEAELTARMRRSERSRRREYVQSSLE
jgi:hypothetical protein